MPPIFWNSQVLNFGYTSTDLTVPSGSTVTVSTGVYRNATVPAGSTLILPRANNVKFSGTLTNNGTITGGSSDVSGTSSTYIANSAYDLLPTQCNGANSPNESTHLGRGALKIMAKKLINNGSITTSGSQWTGLDGYGYPRGITGNGAGFVWIVSEKISGTGTISATGGAGQGGHGGYNYQYGCTHDHPYEPFTEWWWCSGTGTACTGRDSATLNYGSHGPNDAYTSYDTCDGYQPGVAAGSNGANASGFIVTSAPPTGGISSGSMSIPVVIAPFAAGIISWWGKQEEYEHY